MRWTKETPTVPGFWWWRDNPKSAIVVRVFVGTDFIGNAMLYASKPLFMAASMPIKLFGGEWYGPLPEPGEDAEPERDAN